MLLFTLYLQNLEGKDLERLEEVAAEFGKTLPNFKYKDYQASDLYVIPFFIADNPTPGVLGCLT